MIVRTVDGRLLIRSDAWIHILRRLNGGWRVIAAVMSVIPRPLRDGAYDFIAAIRHRLFRPPPDLCPVLSPEEQARFDP
jgi:predicted DCC family thiol-disulfide oxidoreductase YuxK